MNLSLNNSTNINSLNNSSVNSLRVKLRKGSNINSPVQIKKSPGIVTCNQVTEVNECISYLESVTSLGLNSP